MLAICMLFTLASFAQQSVTISGTIKNSKNNEVVPAVSITIKGTSYGTFTDDKGNFKITTAQKLPLTLVFTSIGYADKEVIVSAATDNLSVSFVPTEALGQEVVVAASRVQERILESPASIERMNTSAIRNAPGPNYYDALANFKGVDLTTSSLNFRTPSTRGFNGSGNLRFNQLVDGMDNQAPGLNFSVGSIVGPSQLDVENVELLQGASSALYGSGGMNGTLLVTSKNPFKYQGLSFMVKTGANHVDSYQRKPAPFHNWDLRWAKKVSDKFAFKIAAEFTQGADWQANDVTGLLRNNVFSTIVPGATRANDPNYDGVNIFGDEASASMQAFAQAVRAQVSAGGGAPALAALNNMIGLGLTPQQIAGQFAGNPLLAPLSSFLPFLIPTSTVANNPYRNVFGGQNVSRTGYAERDLVDYNNYNLKLSGAVHYKITNKIEASLQAYYGLATSVYTGSDRYSLKNLNMGQYKLEVKHKNWFVRAYTTQENSGDSYTATTAAVSINNAWKSNATWFQQYTGTYSAAFLGLVTGVPSNNPTIAHGAARNVAETGRWLPGSAQFNAAFQNAINTPVSKGGARFSDRTNLYHYEGQYNFSDLIKVVDVLVGANYRTFVLNSQGTIFADTAGSIRINEFGGYIQFQKKLFKDVLKLTASGRYDKSTNFEGRFTPRVSATIKVATDNHIRLSYQTAYRFPSTQDQYINLQTPSARLIGGLPSFNTFYNFNNSPAYTAESIVAYRASLNAGAPNPTLLQAAPFSTLKPETVISYEVGYRGVIAKKLLVDAYYYYTKYNDFIGRVAVGRGQSGIAANAPIELASPFTTTNYSFVSNSTQAVNAQGWGLSAEYKFYKDFVFTGNVSGDQLSNVPAGTFTQFNTPKLRYNIGVRNENVWKNFGFNILYRWQDQVEWQGTFGTGDVPAYGTWDGFISYKFPQIKSMFKIGGMNLWNKYYRSAFGNPQIGGMYYMSFGYNIF